VPSVCHVAMTDDSVMRRAIAIFVDWSEVTYRRRRHVSSANVRHDSPVISTELRDVTYSSSSSSKEMDGRRSDAGLVIITAWRLLASSDILLHPLALCTLAPTRTTHSTDLARGFNSKQKQSTKPSHNFYSHDYYRIVCLSISGAARNSV